MHHVRKIAVIFGLIGLSTAFAQVDVPATAANAPIKSNPQHGHYQRLITIPNVEPALKLYATKGSSVVRMRINKDTPDLLHMTGRVKDYVVPAGKIAIFYEAKKYTGRSHQVDSNSAKLSDNDLGKAKSIRLLATDDGSTVFERTLTTHAATVLAQ